MSSSPHKTAVRDFGKDLAMYRKPRLYDVAFGFRDIPAECDGILSLAKRNGIPRPKRVLELACGPAHHLREFARRGLECEGIDINPEMLAYARALCQREKLAVKLRHADMRSFSVGKRFDIVLCIFDSFAQNTTEQDAVATLRSAAAALKPGGLLFVEFTHPADYFSKRRSLTSERWTQSDGELTVKARFTITRLDPVAETFVASLILEPQLRNGRRVKGKRLIMRWQQRMWLRGGFQYVALASGCFDIVGWFGDISPVVPLSSSTQAWRMIALLRKH